MVDSPSYSPPLPLLGINETISAVLSIAANDSASPSSIYPSMNASLFFFVLFGCYVCLVWDASVTAAGLSLILN